MRTPREITTIFFDYGGTLSDFYPTNAEIWARIAQRLGVQISPDDPRILNGMKEQMREYERYNVPSKDLTDKEWHMLNCCVLNSLGIDKEDTQEIINAEFRSREQELRYTLYPETFGTLQKIKQIDLKIGLISNIRSQGAVKRRPTMKEQGILDFFDAVILSGEVGVGKPDKEIFEIALREIGVQKPNEAMYVGDSPIEDLKGAQNAGLIPVFLDRLDWFSAENVIKIEVLSDILQYLK